MLNVVIAVFILVSTFLQLLLLHLRGISHNRLYSMESPRMRIAAFGVQIIMITSAVACFAAIAMGIESELRFAGVPFIIWSAVLLYGLFWVRCIQLCLQKSSPDLSNQQS